MPYLIMAYATGTGSGPNHANVQLLGDSASHVGIEGLDFFSSTRFTFKTDGGVDINESSTSATDPWWIPAPEASIGDSYEIQYTVDSGDTPTGMTAGTWNALTSNQYIDLTQSGVGSKSGTYTVRIRDAATQTVRATGTYSLSSAMLP